MMFIDEKQDGEWVRRSGWQRLDAVGRILLDAADEVDRCGHEYAIDPLNQACAVIAIGRSCDNDPEMFAAGCERLKGFLGLRPSMLLSRWNDMNSKETVVAALRMAALCEARI